MVLRSAAGLASLSSRSRVCAGPLRRSGRALLHSVGTVARQSAAPPHFSGSDQDMLTSDRRVKVVLLENIHPCAVEIFEDRNFVVETHSSALSGQELIDVAADAHILGIRSKTQLTADFFDTIGYHKHRLWGVGCFCIGTNQVDLSSAARNGVTVFNAPFSNTRSVAEKTICEAIALQRRLFQASMNVHNGEWKKSADGSREVRGKTLGIVGYGRIGSQVSVLAEGMGMKVLYHDAKKTLSLGNAEPAASMEDLLSRADVVTLHVPENWSTRNLMTAEMIAKMKPGAQLINNARGDVVDIEALCAALDDGHISGAAIDVYPQEPEGNTSAGGFATPLAGKQNVILTPHIGGSTEEAQANIGEEVAEKLVSLLSTGSTLTSVNVPEVELGTPQSIDHRLLHFHRNVPGVLAAINAAVLSFEDTNVSAQYLKTDAEHGYVILDVGRETAFELKQKLREIDNTVWCRSLLRSTGEFGSEADVREWSARGAAHGLISKTEWS